MFSVAPPTATAAAAAAANDSATTDNATDNEEMGVSPSDARCYRR